MVLGMLIISIVARPNRGSILVVTRIRFTWRNREDLEAELDPVQVLK